MANNQSEMVQGNANEMTIKLAFVIMVIIGLPILQPQTFIHIQRANDSVRNELLSFILIVALNPPINIQRTFLLRMRSHRISKSPDYIISTYNL